MVDDSALREKITLATQGIWGTLNNSATNSIRAAFGTVRAPSTGAGVYYNVEGFYANALVNVGDNYTYVYNQFKNEMKPRRFQRFAAGVSITEEQMALDSESLRGIVEGAALKQQRALDFQLELYGIGFKTEKSLVAAMNLQGTASSSIIDPADCNSTPGTTTNCQAVKWSGAGQTESAINATVGVCQRLIAGKVIDTTTGESILRNDGTDSYDLWVHPIFAKILQTNKELMDTGEHDSITYAERLKSSWATTIRPTLQIEDATGGNGDHPNAVLTANTKENYFIVEVESPTWMAWSKIDNGVNINWVKRYKAGLGAVAKPYLSGTQAYKAQASFDSIPYATS